MIQKSVLANLIQIVFKSPSVTGKFTTIGTRTIQNYPKLTITEIKYWLRTESRTELNQLKYKLYRNRYLFQFDSQIFQFAGVASSNNGVFTKLVQDLFEVKIVLAFTKVLSLCLCKFTGPDNFLYLKYLCKCILRLHNDKTHTIYKFVDIWNMSISQFIGPHRRRKFHFEISSKHKSFQRFQFSMIIYNEEMYRNLVPII